MPKNREKYITSHNEYDLLMNIEKNTGICPIRAVKDISREEKIERCYKYIHTGCKTCVREWLNEEEGARNG